MYSKNILSFLGLIIGKDNQIVQPFADEILVASLLVQGKEVKNAMVRDLLGGPK